jgi:hypothetical protein
MAKGNLAAWELVLILSPADIIDYNYNACVLHTDKKETQIFLIYKEIQNGAVAKSYMTNGLLIQYMGKYLCISSSIRKPSSYMTLQLLHSEFPYI